MMFRREDTDIHYDVTGRGPDVVLLHPFPSSREFWSAMVPYLEARYRVIVLDLRGLGESAPGEGIATMAKHASDIRRLCDELKVTRAVFVGCSIGGYILFECWRQFRDRFRALVLCDTKAEADDETAKANRYQAAEDVLKRGPELYISASLPKLLGETTQRNRPDVFASARATTVRSTAEGIAAVQKGMAARPDSTPILPSINVPTLVIVGEEDAATPPAVVEKMAKAIPGAEFRKIAKAGHYSPFEQPEEVGKLLRQWLERLPGR